MSFLLPKIASVCWPSSLIAIARSNMCGGRTLCFLRTACLCKKWRVARPSVDLRSGAGKRDTLSRDSTTQAAAGTSSPRFAHADFCQRGVARPTLDKLDIKLVLQRASLYR